MKLIKKSFNIHFGIFFIFLLAGIYITYPLIFHIGDYVIGFGDELVIAWIQNWVIHALSSLNFSSFFNANIYFPFNNTLAYSDLFLTSSLLSIIPLIIFREPIVVFNFTLISSLVLLSFSIYLLSYYLTKNITASLTAGLLMIFSPAVLDKTTHLQILAIQWIPLSVLYFLHFIRTAKSRYLTCSLLFFLLQTYNSFLPGYFILFFYVIILSFYFFMERKRFLQVISIKNSLLIILTLLLLLPVVIPYYQVSKEFNYVRDIRDTIHFALQPEDLVYPDETSRLKDVLLSVFPVNKYPENAEIKPGYVGFVFSILSILSLAYLFKTRKKRDIYLLIFVTAAVTGLILSFGPLLHFDRQTIHKPFPVVLPYALFYYVLPGFQGFRNSARWEMLFILAMAVFIATVLHKALQKQTVKTKIIVYVLLLAGVIGEFNFPNKFYKVPQKAEFPPVYNWLSQSPKDTKIIELPVYNWGMWPYTQSELFREYYSTVHYREMVNGYSGFSPPPWQELITNTLTDFPSDTSVENLKMIGITNIIIHKEEYDLMHKDKYMVNKKIIPDGKTIIERTNKMKTIKLIKKFDDTYVYSF